MCGQSRGRRRKHLKHGPEYCKNQGVSEELRHSEAQIFSAAKSTIGIDAAPLEKDAERPPILPASPARTHLRGQGRSSWAPCGLGCCEGPQSGTHTEHPRRVEHAYSFYPLNVVVGFALGELTFTGDGSTSATFTASSPTPEPSSGALLGTGLLGLVGQHAVGSSQPVPRAPARAGSSAEPAVCVTACFPVTRQWSFNRTIRVAAPALARPSPHPGTAGSAAP